MWQNVLYLAGYLGSVIRPNVKSAGYPGDRIYTLLAWFFNHMGLKWMKIPNPTTKNQI